MQRNRLVTLILIVCFSLPLAAHPRGRDRDRDPSPVERVLKIVKRIVGISTTGDLPSPPKP
jgi:hypothetical protein